MAVNSGSATINVNELDLSTRVSSYPGVYGAIVLPDAKKGPVETPMLVTSEEQLLRYFTPNKKIEIGFDNAYFSALAFLQKSNKLWVVRPDTKALYAGALFNPVSIEAATPNVALDEGKSQEQVDSYVFDEESFLLVGANPGEWNKNIKVKVYNYHPDEELHSDDFDPSTEEITVNPTANSGAEWTTGESVRFYAKQGILPGGLVSGTTYYVEKQDDPTKIKLYSTYAAAVAGDAAYLVNIKDKGTYKTFTSSPGEIDVHDNRITIPTHGCNTGMRIRFTSTGTLPSPLTEGTVYYVRRVSDSIIEVYDTEAHARTTTGTTGIIDITDVGSSLGTHTLLIGEFIIMPAEVKVKDANQFLIEVYWHDVVGSTNTLVESWFCSKNVGAKDSYGRNIYLETVLEASEYIRGIDNTLEESPYPKAQPELLAFAGGLDDLDGNASTDSTLINALTPLYSDDYSLSLIMDGGWATAAYHNELKDLAESRKDCIAIFSVPYSDEASSDYVNEILKWRRVDDNINSSYCVMVTPHAKVFDKFNGRSLYVPVDGYFAAAISDTYANFELWYPVAGYKRGIIDVLDLRRRFSKGEMDIFYDNGINCIRFVPGKGIVIWGQKTLYNSTSALDRLNVRFLLIVIELACKQALEQFLFELNDEATRGRVKYLLTSYMDSIKARRGVTDFSVVCDSSNNTPNDIQNYILNVDLYIKPTYSIEYINFTVVITQEGMSFQLASTLV